METKKIIIVGGGAAGLSAASEAAERGFHAIVLEELPKLGGNGQFAEVMFALNSCEHKKRGYTSDIDAWFHLSMQHSHWKNNALLVRAMLEYSGHNMDWLCDHGLDILGFQDEGASELGCATHYSEGMHTGAAAISVLKGFCEASPFVEIHTSTHVDYLISDEDDRVIGVSATCKGESETYFGCGVILACGGFLGNQELISRIIPGIDAGVFAHGRGIKMKGNGILLAESVGADICSDGCFENAGPVFAGDSRIMSLVTKRNAIWLNCMGRRFADESIGDNFVFGCNAVYAQPQHRCYVVLDTKMLKSAIEGPVDFLAGPEAVLRGTSGIYEAIQKEIKVGRVFVSDSFEGLAEFIGASPAVLSAELEQYNEFCCNGKDACFLKPANLLEKLEEGPFYAIECGVDHILTHGGIRVNEDMQVVRMDGTLIAGLFAAGADISGIDANGYQVSMGGHSLGFSMTGGRIAVRSIDN